MFEQEIELEKKEGSSFGPVLIIFLLVAVFAGGLGAVIYQSRQTLKPEEAKAALVTRLHGSAPVTVSFHTGNVSYAASDKPSDPQYKLLENAGLLKVGKGKGYAAQVDLTPAGKQFVDSLPGVQQAPDKDGNTVYTLPLASRELVSVGDITKLGAQQYRVQYTWAWHTTPAGDLFDVAGKDVQGLSLYERSVLIDQHGANYYHAPPAQTTITLTKGDK